MARCPRAGCDTPEVQILPDPVIELCDPDNSALRLALDEIASMLYVSGGRGIARMPADFSAQLGVFYEDPQSVKGLAVVGGSVYMAVSSLIGQIRRCPTMGCAEGAQLVAEAPRWPYGLIADQRSMYWLHPNESTVVTPIDMGSPDNPFIGDLAIATCSLDGSESEPEFIEIKDQNLPSIVPLRLCDPVMNSHHLYWCGLGASTFQPAATAIRMVER